MQNSGNIIRPGGTLPTTDRVKAVEEYLDGCRTATLARVLNAHVRGDLREVVAGVREWFGAFIDIEITVRDAVQNIALREFAARPNCSACGGNFLRPDTPRDETDLSLCISCACGVRPTR